MYIAAYCGKTQRTASSAMEAAVRVTRRVQLTGGSIFSLGVWIRCDLDARNQVFGPNDVLEDHAEAYLLITIGAVVMLISFFACFGALLENQCMLAVVRCSVRHAHTHTHNRLTAFGLWSGTTENLKFIHHTGCSALRGVAAPRVMLIRLAAISRNIRCSVRHTVTISCTDVRA